MKVSKIHLFKFTALGLAFGASATSFAGLDDGLVGYWKMDSVAQIAGGDYFPDASGLGNNLLLRAGVEIVHDVASFTNGPNQNCLLQPVKDALGNTLVTKAYTISTWINVPPEASTAQWNAYPRVWDGDVGLLHLNGSGDAAGFTCKGGNVSANLSHSMLVSKDRWMHIALTMSQAYDSSAGKDKVTVNLYCNGVRVDSGNQVQDAVSSAGVTMNQLWLGGCYGSGAGATAADRRNLVGWMKEARLYNRALSEAEIRSLYVVRATAEAEDDFTVATDTARLGASLDTLDSTTSPAAGEIAGTWKAISVPEGLVASDVTAAITPVGEASAVVSLPTLGAYVFRYVPTPAGIAPFKEVRVTRVAAVEGNVAPTVDVTATPTSCSTWAKLNLSAAIADPDGGPGSLRAFWRVQSGAGARIENPFGRTATATFTAAGTYVFECVASDGQDETAATVSVSVTGSAATTVPTPNWQFKFPYHASYYAMNSGSTHQGFDGLRPSGSTRPFLFDEGIDGYGMRPLFPSAILTDLYKNGAAFNLNTVANSGSKNIALAAWVKPDVTVSSEWNDFEGIVTHDAIGLYYDRKQNRGVFIYSPSVIITDRWRWEFALPEIKGRWAHFYAHQTSFVYNDDPQSKVKFWCDGVACPLVAVYYNDTPQPIPSGTPTKNMSAPASTTRPITVGQDYQAYLDPVYAFAGVIDNAEIYYANLTAEQIATLARRRTYGTDGAPTAVPVVREIAGQAQEPLTVSATVADDGLPSGSTLTYQWSVAPRQANKVTFEDASALTTRVTFSRGGIYLLTLKASDGERVVWSEAVRVTLPPLGLAIILR